MEVRQHFWGIDIGSRFTKVVKINHKYEILEKFLTESIGVITEFPEFCKRFSINPENSVFTGYGRELAKNSGFKIINEVKAVEIAVKSVLDVEGFIDIGGQDIKVVCFKTREINLNTSCAAGTGSFIENILRRLNTGWDDFFKIEDHETDVALNSVCAVFAESEAITLLVKGVEKSKIMKAAAVSVAKKVITLIPQGCKRFAFLGRLAASKAIKSYIEKSRGVTLVTPPNYEYFASLGAAIKASNLFG